MSCAKDPFSTRNSEPPYGAGGTWETPQSPEVVVRNMLFSYNERIISNYQLCFSDSFIFSAQEDSIDAVNNGRGDLFAGWDKQVEIAASTNIFSTFSNVDSLKLFLAMSPTPGRNDIIEDSTAILYRDYSLKIISVDSTSSDTLAADGLATFHLSQEQLNWWTIQWWEDVPATPGGFDWGDFKAEYRR